MAWNRSSSAKNLPPHNHEYASGFDTKSPDCPRCIANASNTGVAIHTCAHGGAFGKRDMTCARCRQLAEGVNVATNIKQEALRILAAGMAASAAGGSVSRRGGRRAYTSHGPSKAEAPSFRAG